MKILNENLPRIKSEYEVTGLCIFGSVARGDNRPDSDIDILVDMPPKIYLLSALKDFLESILKTSVDLIRHHSHLSPEFQSEITRNAITIL
ncbi:MAG: nucleotidyltransferase domain-containing protein [Duncaniella sp.]|nr:nucleotidyltransferase domain-containing protein [Duncaniella sp.]